MFKNLLYQKLMRRIFKAYLSVKFGVKEFEIEENAKCLCLCPHQDDESIGMGGTLAKYNKNFTVICLTNGAKGLKSLPKEEAIKVRCDEFESALSKASISDFKVLDIEDRALQLRYQEGKKFFDPKQKDVFPERDFWLSIRHDVFDHVIRVIPEDGMYETEWIKA